MVAVALPTNWATSLTDADVSATNLRTSCWIFLNFFWGIDNVIDWLCISKPRNSSLWIGSSRDFLIDYQPQTFEKLGDQWNYLL